MWHRVTYEQYARARTVQLLHEKALALLMHIHAPVYGALLLLVHDLARYIMFQDRYPSLEVDYSREDYLLW